MNWSATTSWQRYNGTAWVAATTANGYPGQNAVPGIVTIQDNQTVTLDVSPANSIGSLVVGASATAFSAALTFGTNNNTLNVSNNITVGSVTGNTALSKSIQVANGTLTIGGSLLIGTGQQGTSGSASNQDGRVSSVQLSGGTINLTSNSSNITFNGAGRVLQAQLLVTGAGTINLGGSITFATASNGTMTLDANSTLNLNGTAAQTLRPGVTTFTYGNININVTG